MKGAWTSLRRSSTMSKKDIKEIDRIVREEGLSRE